MPAEFDIFEGSGGNWYWHLKANNNEIVAQSEGYSTKGSAEDAPDAVRVAVLDEIVGDADHVTFTTPNGEEFYIEKTVGA